MQGSILNTIRPKAELMVYCLKTNIMIPALMEIIPAVRKICPMISMPGSNIRSFIGTV